MFYPLLILFVLYKTLKRTALSFRIPRRTLHRHDCTKPPPGAPQNGRRNQIAQSSSCETSSSVIGLFSLCCCLLRSRWMMVLEIFLEKPFQEHNFLIVSISADNLFGEQIRTARVTRLFIHETRKLH